MATLTCTHRAEPHLSSTASLDLSPAAIADPIRKPGLDAASAGVVRISEVKGEKKVGEFGEFSTKEYWGEGGGGGSLTGFGNYKE